MMQIENSATPNFLKPFTTTMTSNLLCLGNSTVDSSVDSSVDSTIDSSVDPTIDSTVDSTIDLIAKLNKKIINLEDRILKLELHCKT